VAWTSRFTDNSNGTVTDNLTGLIWLKNANCTETVGGITGGLNTWADALTFCNNLASRNCGLTDGSAAGDWRLPNRNEMNSLIDSSRFNLALPAGHPFNNVQADYYWSATTYSYNTSSAWHLYLNDGNVDYYDKTYTDCVWPVRGGQ
jgi:hypothetical protein